MEDNKALYCALKENPSVLPIFIFDKIILEKLPKNDGRVSFIYDSLSKLHNHFEKYGSGLKIYYGNPEQIWQEIIEKYKPSKVYWNRDYEPYALKRDRAVVSLLKKNQISFFTFKDHVIFETTEVLKANGQPYTVFTPYKNKWLSQFSVEMAEADGKPAFKNLFSQSQKLPSLKDLSFETSSQIVKPIQTHSLHKYEENRNIPSLDCTSYLGPHLRFGTISLRKIIRNYALDNPAFFNELIWREFFMQILFHFPNVINSSFKQKYDNISWRNNKAEFKLWTLGKTGYPMVDAGMRQLNETGYMHNRVRMVTASFLCKHLLVDWRWGEKYFAQKLLDYELSSNNGNWQWAAGTGCDAAPYFRIFNPHEQLKKFDSDLSYANKYIPELNSKNYPEPIVDHKFARQRALDTYSKALS